MKPCIAVALHGEEEEDCVHWPLARAGEVGVRPYGFLTGCRSAKIQTLAEDAKATAEVEFLEAPKREKRERKKEHRYF